MVGPDFKSPSLPAGATDHYTAKPLSGMTAETVDAGAAGKAQHLSYGQVIPDAWWTQFHSDALNQLVQSALAHSPNLEAAQAALRQAQENYNAQAGTVKYPTVAAQLGATRERAELFGTTPTTLNLFNAAVNVSYTLDLFGGAHRGLESLAAQVDYQRYQTEAAYQTLVANVITTAITEASLRAQLQATREVLDTEQKQLDLVQKQFDLGAIPRSTLLNQQTQVAQTQALVSPLEKSLDFARHQLAIYVGKLPSEEGLPELDLASLQLPADLPVSLPSELVRKRPDIRANEALLHQANAALGVAVANQYPQINLTGSYGVDRAQTGSFSANSTLWNFGAGITQPIFNGGSLSAKRRAAAAARDQAEAQYRQTVLGAFQNVADSLRAIDADANTLQAQAHAASLAKASLDLGLAQYKLGAIAYLPLLDAQRLYQQTHISLVQAQAARYTDTVALYQSLGGSWLSSPQAKE